jgi:uncharacterized protein (DUF3820 family)
MYTAALTDKDPMPFGKHRGTKMANIPAAYLLWLFNAGCENEAVKKYIINNLDGLNAEISRSKSTSYGKGR